jgi:transposase
MPTSRSIVLTPEQRAECRHILETTQVTHHRRQRALILLLAERRPGERGPTNDMIAQWAGVNRRTVTRVRRSFLHDGFARTLQSQPPSHLAARKLSPDQEQRLLSLLETAPPPGHPRWTVRTLARAASDLEAMPEVSRELVRRLLKRYTSDSGKEDPQEDSPASVDP